MILAASRPYPLHVLHESPTLYWLRGCSTASRLTPLVGFRAYYVKDFDATVVSVVVGTLLIACGLCGCDVFVFAVNPCSHHCHSLAALFVQSATSALTTGVADTKTKLWGLDKKMFIVYRTLVVECLDVEHHGNTQQRRRSCHLCATCREWNK